MKTKTRYLPFAVMVALTCSALFGCSQTLEEAACQHAAETTDCPAGVEVASCVQGFEAIARVSDAAGCGAEFDAVLECYARTDMRCAGANWPGCQALEQTWTTCCAASGGGC